MTENIELSDAIAEYLYTYLEPSDSDIPKDEYAPEARILIERVQNGRLKPNDSEDIARALNEIFLEMTEHEYGVDRFLVAGKDLRSFLT